MLPRCQGSWGRDLTITQRVFPPQGELKGHAQRLKEGGSQGGNREEGGRSLILAALASNGDALNLGLLRDADCVGWCGSERACSLHWTDGVGTDGGDGFLRWTEGDLHRWSRQAPGG